jgi:large subunit ribosomal protein L25
MAHETPLITAEPRDRVGSRYCQRLRQQGRLPAIIYGHGIDPVPVHVNEKEVLTHLHHGQHVISVQLAGATETCLVKDLQFGWLGDNVIHIDFARVDLNEEVEVRVHLKFVGSPAEASKPGSVLTHDITELEVVCKVKDIPEFIRVDLSKMGDVFHVSEITLPPGLRTNLDPETVVAHISFIHEEVVAVGEAAAVTTEGAAAEPEVTTEVKAKERAAEKEEKKKDDKS